MAREAIPLMEQLEFHRERIELEGARFQAMAKPDFESLLGSLQACVDRDSPHTAGIRNDCSAASKPLEVKADPKDLPRELERIWMALKGECLSCKELLLALGLPASQSNQDATRQRICRLNRSGFPVVNNHRRGYFRPDAPPSG